jgi:hypothetical protein
VVQRGDGGGVGGGVGGGMVLQKLITVLGRFDTYYKGGERVGFINIDDMYNNDIGKGGVYAYET